MASLSGHEAEEVVERLLLLLSLSDLLKGVKATIMYKYFLLPFVSLTEWKYVTCSFISKSPPSSDRCNFTFDPNSSVGTATQHRCRPRPAYPNRVDPEPTKTPNIKPNQSVQTLTSQAVPKTPLQIPPPLMKPLPRNSNHIIHSLFRNRAMFPHYLP